MNTYDQGYQNQYQPGGYATYQGPPNEPMMSPQPQPQSQPQPQPYNYGPNYGQQPIYNQPQGPYKAEEPGQVSYEYIVRRGFIVKTYGILLSQLAITCLFISLTFFDGVKKFVQNSIDSPIILAFLVIFIIVTFVVCIVFSCCRETARTVPINYILLFSFTLCMSFYCFLLCSQFETKLVISAAILTFGATVGLTIYAAKTSTDYTFCGAFLFAFLLILVFAGILFIWINFTVIYLTLGVLVYSLYLIYDTQLIIGNKTFEYNVDDYCLAALNLYIDIIYMFIKILQILAVLRGNS